MALGEAELDTAGLEEHKAEAVCVETNQQSNLCSSILNYFLLLISFLTETNGFFSKFLEEKN